MQTGLRPFDDALEDVGQPCLSVELDLAVVFSQDQDLAEITRELRDIAQSQGQWLKIVSAFSHAPNASAIRRRDRTHWFRMDREFYETCLDQRDYRPSRRAGDR